MEEMARGSKAFFSSATHLGLMATPKRDDHVDTYAYFGANIKLFDASEGLRTAS